MTGTLDRDHPSLAPHLERLGPYLVDRLEAGAQRALWLHADHVSLEHVLGVTVMDEASAVGQVIEHAFADAETVDGELLALSPGLMVVGAKAVLPFSPASLDALRSARRGALEADEDRVTCARLVVEALASLPGKTGEALSPGDWPGADFEASTGTSTDPGPNLTPDGHLFQGLAEPVKRSLVRACRSAVLARETSIGPLRLIMAALEEDGPLREASGWTATRVRKAADGATVDPTPLSPRLLAPSGLLVEILAGLPDGSGSIDLLDACLKEEDSELGVLFQRHRITPELLERARSAFTDPPLQAG